MDESEQLAERFEEHRTHLKAVAYRILGSISEADDAVQALTFRQLVPFTRPALINGAAGVVVRTRDQTLSVMAFTVTDGQIVAIDVLADPERLARITLPDVFSGALPELG